MLLNIKSHGDNLLEEVEAINFSDLPFFKNEKALEEDLENIIASNVSIIDPSKNTEDSRTILIIGRQVRTVTLRRMDLVAIDSSGAIILIEVKRDIADVKGRKDHAEIQSVRYAASLATLRSIDQLVSDIYGPYIKKFCAEELESEGGGRSADEWARKKLIEFIEDNQIERSQINHRQEIVLIGAGFDDDTKSATAWLAANGLPIRLIEVNPMRSDEDYFFNVQQVIPVDQYNDFYVDLMNSGKPAGSSSKSTKPGSKTIKLRLGALIETGKVKVGDSIHFLQKPDKKATIVDGTHCHFNGQTMKIQEWIKAVSGWSNINIYYWVQHEPTGKKLDDLREELQADIDQTAASSTEDTSISLNDPIK